MAGNFIPPADADCAAMAATMAAVLTADPTAYGLVAGDATALTNASNAFAAALADSNTIQASAAAAVAAKVDARTALETLIRADARQIQADPAVTPTLLAAAGLPVHDIVPTDSAPAVPSMLVCTPHGNGINNLSWDRNGNLPNTHFHVWAKRGAATDFVLAGAVTATKFADASPNGAAVIYKVTARRGALTSGPSNEAHA